MADLKREYTDTKNIRHKVEHLTAPEKDSNTREMVVEALFYALTKNNKRITA